MAATHWKLEGNEDNGGATAFNCPACQNTVVGDRVPASSDSGAVYVTCRLCGQVSDLSPETVFAIVDPRVCLPGPDVLQLTNPSLEILPENRPAALAALFRLVEEECQRQNNDDKVTGLTGGLALISIFLVIFLMVKVLSVTNNATVAFISAPVFLAVDFTFILWLHRKLVHRAVLKQIGQYLHNTQAFSGMDPGPLAEAAAREKKPVRRFFQFLLKRQAKSPAEVPAGTRLPAQACRPGPIPVGGDAGVPVIPGPPPAPSSRIVRLWRRGVDVLVGVLMVVLSLLVQWVAYALASMILLGAAGALGLEISDKTGQWLYWLLIVSFLVLVNGLACYEYFRLKRTVSLGTPGMRPGIHAAKAMVSPDSKHAAGFIFLVPRGLDQALWGRDNHVKLDAASEDESPAGSP